MDPIWWIAIIMTVLIAGGGVLYALYAESRRKK